MMEKAARSGDRSSLDEEQMNELVHALANGVATACGHEVDRNDLGERLEEVLASLGVDVVGAEELERSKEREELADFVGGLMKDRDPADALAESLQDAQEAVLTGQPITASFAPPPPIAAEEIRRGDLIVVVDGRIRLHDRAEAVKRLLSEFALWSGGFKPGETTDAERHTFLCGRDLDDEQEAAMWPERHGTVRG